MRTFAHLSDVDDGGNNGRLRLTRNGEQVWIVDTYNDDFPEGAESSFARTVCVAGRLFPGAQFLKAIHFKRAEPPYRAESDHVFRLPIVFGSDRNGVVTDAAWLEQRPEAPSRQVFEIVKARAETLLQRVESANSTRGRVEALLMSILHTLT